MVHQSYVFFCDNKLPDGTVTEIRIPGQQTKNKAIQCGLTAILTCRQVRNGCCSQACGSGNDEEWLVWWDWLIKQHHLHNTNTTRTVKTFRCLLVLFRFVVRFSSKPSLPSSTNIARFPLGDKPTQVMFFVVEMGNVSEVLLGVQEK